MGTSGNIFEKRELVEYIIEALLSPSVKIDQAWNTAIGKLFLEPYGLNSDIPISLNSLHAKDILSRNKLLEIGIDARPGKDFFFSNNFSRLNLMMDIQTMDQQ